MAKRSFSDALIVVVLCHEYIKNRSILLRNSKLCMSFIAEFSADKRKWSEHVSF